MNSQNLNVGQDELEKAFAAFDTGDLATSSALVRKLMETQSYDPRVLRLAARLAIIEGKFQDSEQLLNRALTAAAQSPQEQANIWGTRGLLSRTVGDIRNAEESYRRAALLDPATAEHALEFAEVLAAHGKLDLAIEVLRAAITRHPADPQPCVTLGNVLLQAGRQRDSLAFYDMALQRNPNFAAAHFNASVALTMLGKIDAARTACKTALALDPTMSGYYQLASLGGAKPGDAVVLYLEDVLKQEDAPAELRIDAGFALGRIYDDAGDTTGAFRALHLANSMKRATFSYDIARDEERAGRIIALFTADFFQRFPQLRDQTLTPIFVLGMPRSGTTLIEQMLAGHSKVQSGGELGHMVDIARQLGEIWGSRGEASPGTVEQVQSDFQNAATDYSRRTQPLQRRPYFTDKLPGNFMFIGIIHQMFPGAKIIHCRRDPVATCLSCYQRLFSSEVPYSYDLTELGQYHKLYQRLMDHWQTVLPAGSILDVDYESVVADPEKNVRRMLEFCGLDFEPACLDFQDVSRTVTTASAVQVRKPLYSSSVDHWKKYGADLDPLLAALSLPPATG